MGAVRIAILATAAVAAILLAFLVRGMMAPKTVAPPPAAVAAVAPPKPMTKVLVAKHDLPVGTRMAAIDMAWQPWPVEALNPNFVTDGSTVTTPPAGASKVAAQASQAASDLVMAQGPMQSFDGAIVKEAMLTGEPIVARKVVRGGQSNYLAVVLTPGSRAMAIPINAETAAGGFILPGDRVDILQSRQIDGKGFSTETLMRNLKVLAIDQHPEPGKDAKSIVGAVAVVEVPAADAEILARGKAQGEMQLALRSYADMAGSAGRGVPGRRGDQNMRVFRGGDAMEVVTR